MDEAFIGIRGYNITGEERLLEPYRQSLPSINAELAIIRKMTADNPSQQKRLTRLDELVTQRLHGIKESLDKLLGGETDAFNRLYLGESGTKLREGILDVLAEMEDITPRKHAAEVLIERTQELAAANTELRAGLAAREEAAQVLTDRTRELADANTELRTGWLHGNRPHRC